jgi:hypothetical protein
MIGKPDELIKWLLNQDREKLFEVKQHRKKRSLNANAYAWVLIGKIADSLRSSKDEVYLMMLKRYGQSEIVSVLSDVNVDGFFKYFEPYAEATLNGKDFIHYKVYKGSSEFDTREMAILIDGLVYEAEELGIETLPPHEVERLKVMWSNT